jgi:hypothetical protein
MENAWRRADAVGRLERRRGKERGLDGGAAVKKRETRTYLRITGSPFWAIVQQARRPDGASVGSGGVAGSAGGGMRRGRCARAQQRGRVPGELLRQVRLAWAARVGVKGTVASGEGWDKRGARSVSEGGW